MASRSRMGVAMQLPVLSTTRPRLGIQVLLAALLSTLAWPAAAQSRTLPSPLRVEHVVRAARDQRPEIVAARARVTALSQRSRIVDALPDPMVMASIDHLPLSMMGADGSLTVQQEFPFSRVRSRRARAATADARREAAEASRVKLDVELDAVNAYFMLLERRRMLAVLRELDASSRQLSAIASAHYAAAHGTQATVLRTTNEISRIQSEWRAQRSEAKAAEAMLNAAIRREPGLAVPALAPPPLDRAPPTLASALAKALAQRPELKAMRYQKQRAEAEVDVMKSMYSPMGLVRAGPAYTMSEGIGLMVMVGVSVPIWRDRLDAGVDEAHAMVTMASADIAAMRNMIRGEIAMARQQVIAARVRLRALRDEIGPRAKQTVDSALASYAATQTDAISVIEAVTTLWDVRAEEVMAEARLGLAWARLDRALGVERARGKRR
jgi:outer membrane protein TolC